jgi:hypothetical protein
MITELVLGWWQGKKERKKGRNKETRKKEYI